MNVMKWLVIGAVLIALGACATVRPATMRTESVDEQIRALEQRQVHAAQAGDRAALEQIFSPQFRLINPTGAVTSRDELMQLLAGGSRPYQSAVYVTETLRVFGDVVVSTGLETVVPARGAQAGQTVQRRITHVWERGDHDWRLMLRQATIVAAPR
jgi:uncharacterized protein (TIGR02246 family)